MHGLERQALATAIQVLAPELVLEVGTESGASARLFSQYVDRVITMDTNCETPHLEGNITKVKGTSPQELSRLEPYLAPDDPKSYRDVRWVFFHDSTHLCEVFTAEALWAFDHGALAVLCHDQSMADMTHTKKILTALGHKYVNLIDLAGVPDAGAFTGIGLFHRR